MLLQPLKLQLKSCLIPFLANLVLSVIIILINELLLHKFYITVIFVMAEIVFSFFYGLYNYSTLSKTYSSLKHDKHYYFLSSLIINLINAIIMVLIFVLLKVMLKRDILSNGEMKVLINYLSLHLAMFSMGSFYSLFLEKYKVVNIISIVLVLMLIVLCFATYKIEIFESFFMSGGCIVYLPIEFIIVFNIVLIIVFNILNKFKYKKS